MTAGPDHAFGEAATLAEVLREATGNLDGYIERRAADLAAAMIHQVIAEAHAVRMGAAFAVQRRQDLADELRKRLDAAHRALDLWREASGCRNPDEMPAWLRAGQDPPVT